MTDDREQERRERARDEAVDQFTKRYCRARGWDSDDHLSDCQDHYGEAFDEGWSSRDAELAAKDDEKDQTIAELSNWLHAIAEETFAAGMKAGDRSVVLANVRELIAEVADWRESARKAAEESCGDEKHCACVGLLRHMVVQLQHGNAELDGEYHRFRDAVADYIEAEGAGGTFDAGRVMAARKLLREIMEG